MSGTTPFRLRVVLLPEYYYPYMGGGEEWFRHIGEGLATLGHSVEVFAFPMSGTRKTEVIDGVRIVRSGSLVIDKWQPYLKRALSHLLTFFFHPIRKAGCDVAIGQGSALLGAFPILWARRIPTICVVHDIYGLHESIRDKGLIKGIARYLAVELLLHNLPLAAWIAVSESTKKKLEQIGVPSSKITIVRNGVDEILLGLKPEKKRNVIAYLGRLVKHKHPEDLIQALSHLNKSLDWSATIAGDGELLPELRTLTQRLGLEGKVRFLGRVDEQEKNTLLSSSSCLVLPSMAEGWGVVLTEAAAVGTPSIAYDVPGVREQASLIKSIILVKPRAISSLTARIRELLESPELVKKFGKSGKASARKLTWERSSRDVNQLLLEVTEKT